MLKSPTATTTFPPLDNGISLRREKGGDEKGKKGEPFLPSPFLPPSLHLSLENTEKKIPDFLKFLGRFFSKEVQMKFLGDFVDKGTGGGRGVPRT